MRRARALRCGKSDRRKSVGRAARSSCRAEFPKSALRNRGATAALFEHEHADADSESPKSVISPASRGRTNANRRKTWVGHDACAGVRTKKFLVVQTAEAARFWRIFLYAKIPPTIAAKPPRLPNNGRFGMALAAAAPARILPQGVFFFRLNIVATYRGAAALLDTSNGVSSVVRASASHGGFKHRTLSPPVGHRAARSCSQRGTAAASELGVRSGPRR